MPLILVLSYVVSVSETDGGRWGRGDFKLGLLRVRQTWGHAPFTRLIFLWNSEAPLIKPRWHGRQWAVVSELLRGGCIATMSIDQQPLVSRLIPSSETFHVETNSVIRMYLLDPSLCNNAFWYDNNFFFPPKDGLQDLPAHACDVNLPPSSSQWSNPTRCSHYPRQAPWCAKQNGLQSTWFWRKWTNEKGELWR